MESQDGEDRISRLHDSILCVILSFLPTEYAVATSILSSRWKLVWISIPNLRSNNGLCSRYKRTNNLTIDVSTRFEKFVNRVLLLPHPSNINKFSLYSSKLRDLASLHFSVSRQLKCVMFVRLNLMMSTDTKLSRLQPARLPKHLRFSNFTLILLSRLLPLYCFFHVLRFFVEMYHPDNSFTETFF